MEGAALSALRLLEQERTRIATAILRSYEDHGDSWSNMEQTMSETQSLHDVFICHASEDKDDFVRPLAEALRARHVDVWFDEFVLTIGDSLREAIDRGLAASRFG